MHTTLPYLLALMMTTISVSAQNATGQLVWSAKEVKVPTYDQSKMAYFLTPRSQSVTNVKNFANSVQKLKVVKKISANSLPLILEAIPDNYFYIQTGWVCKQEWQLEKAINIPVKLRLGNIEQVDLLEGKFIHR